MTRSIALFALLALSLTACVSAETRALRKSPDYRAGYDDGCSAATAAGTSYKGVAVRNDEAYQSIKAYRLGWNSGYSSCRRTTPGEDHGGLLSQPGPGH